MNIVGKIFIVTILVMSLVFMSFAISVYSTSNNWRETAKAKKLELDKAKSDLSALQAKMTNLQKSCDEKLAQKGNEIAALTTAREEITRELETKNTDLTTLQTQMITALATVRATHDEMQTARAELVSLREKFRKTQQDWNALFTEYVKKSDEAHYWSMQLSNLEAVSQELVQQYNDAKVVLDQFGLKPVPSLYQGIPPFQVAGQITEVRPNGLVEISIGEDTGLMKGHQLDVYRKADGKDVYLGVVEVLLTEPNRAACKVLPEYRRGTIQPEDVVTSEFSQERQKYQMKRDSHVATVN